MPSGAHYSLWVAYSAQQLKANGPDDYSQEDPNNSYLISTLNAQAARQYLRSGTFKMPT